MNKPSENQLENARKQFLAGNPDVKAKIDALTVADAEKMCTSLENHRKQETMRAIQQYAREEGVDAAELLFSLAADTAEEFGQWKDTRDRVINKASK